MKELFLSCFGGLALAGAALAQDLPTGDPAAGRQIAGQCRTCHGLDGYAKIPIAPHIGGEPASYLVAQLTAFRDGTRENEIMSIAARALSDQNIADVASWYAQHQALATMTMDEADAPEACAGCHGANGIALVADAPNLAGETNIYIETQLKAFRNGNRMHDVMTPLAAGLDDADIRALADWFASIELEIKPLQ
jgi:cytochrome c553